MSKFFFDLRPLEIHMVQRCKWRGPGHTITAPPPSMRTHSARAEENRRAYIAQSAATRGGKVAEPSFA